jgi:ABC-type uncharacterized transport system ATPase subunit
MIYGLDEFDCEILIPDLNEIKMEGDTIILPPHVLKVCDELIESKKKKAIEAEQDMKLDDQENNELDSKLN